MKHHAEQQRPEDTQRQSLVDDIEIVKNVQAGNSESFALLVNKYHRHLLNFIYRLIGNELIVEDIGQDVFLSVYKSIRSFNVNRGVPFSAWLFITARNRCISELRKNDRLTIPAEGLADLTAHGKTPEQTVINEERLLAIHAALEQLPEPYRQTVLESLRGDSPEEIARNNGISRGTVKSRLSRAREKMKLLLYERFGGHTDGRI
jgi:RNA polymerase sigma-70 factor (ECF subfamily)